MQFEIPIMDAIKIPFRLSVQHQIRFLVGDFASPTVKLCMKINIFVRPLAQQPLVVCPQAFNTVGIVCDELLDHPLQRPVKVESRGLAIRKQASCKLRLHQTERIQGLFEVVFSAHYVVQMDKNDGSWTPVPKSHYDSVSQFQSFT